MAIQTLPPHASRPEDRRREPRILVNIHPLETRRTHDNRIEAVEVVILNLSSGGLLTCSRQSVAIGDRLEFVLARRADAPSLHVAAEVVWVQQFGPEPEELWAAGCRFTGASTLDRDTLREIDEQTRGTAHDRT